MRCFEDSPSLDLLDRETFKFQHKLMGHPALTLENLSRVLPALSEGRVKHSKGLLKNGDDFESVMCRTPTKVLTIEEILGPENQWVEEDHKEADVLRQLHEANMMFCLTWARIPLPGKGLMHRAGMFPISEETFRLCEESGWAFPDEETLQNFLDGVKKTDPDLFKKPTNE